MMILNVLDNYTRTCSLLSCGNVPLTVEYHASIVSKLWTQNYEISSTDVRCHRCGMMYKDKYVNAVVVCEYMALLNEDFYAHVRHTFGDQVYNELCSGSDERKLMISKVYTIFAISFHESYCIYLASFPFFCTLSLSLSLSLSLYFFLYLLSPPPHLPISMYVYEVFHVIHALLFFSFSVLYSSFHVCVTLFKIPF